MCQRVVLLVSGSSDDAFCISSAVGQDFYQICISMYHCETQKHAKVFAKMVQDELTKVNPTYASFVDLSIYKSHQYLDLAGNTEESDVFVRDKEKIDWNEYFVGQIHPASKLLPFDDPESLLDSTTGIQKHQVDVDTMAFINALVEKEHSSALVEEYLFKDGLYHFNCTARSEPCCTNPLIKHKQAGVIVFIQEGELKLHVNTQSV